MDYRNDNKQKWDEFREIRCPISVDDLFLIAVPCLLLWSEFLRGFGDHSQHGTEVSRGSSAEGLHANQSRNPGD